MTNAGINNSKQCFHVIFYLMFYMFKYDNIEVVGYDTRSLAEEAKDEDGLYSDCLYAIVDIMLYINI